jgi:hypothetical protein
VLRAWYLQQLFAGFDFLRHALRGFLPTVPAVAVVIVARLLEPRGRTLTIALAELVAYILVTLASTWCLESGLLREALGQVRGRPAPAPS